MQPIRQGDVLLLPVAQTDNVVVWQEFGQKLSHLTLAEGEVIGHKHRINQGEA